MKRGANLGSGQRRFTSVPEVEWTNCDIVSREGEEPDVVCDMSSVPFPDGHFDYVVYHQTLEHNELSKGVQILREGYRLLAPNGSMLIFIPDIKALAIKWLSGGIDDYIYSVNLMGAWRGAETDFHRWHHTFDSLKKSLQSVGPWKSIEKFDWHPILGSSFARDWWVLAVEATK